MNNVERWEMLWGNYIDKLNRLEELKAMGRYGYQLRMPKKSLAAAIQALETEFPEEARLVFQV